MMLNTTTSYNSSEQPAVDNLFIGLPVENSVRITVVILGWLACVTGIFGNVLIITTLLSQQSLRSVHNIYIANLALADLLVMGYVFPFWLLDLALGANPVANQTHCDANAFIIILTFVVSVYTLVLIACDRFMSVCHNPIYTKLFNRTSIVASCVVVWLLAGCEGMVPLFRLGDTSFIYSPRSHLCSFDGTNPRNPYSIISTLNLIMPTVLIAFFSLSILRFWRRSKNRIGQWSRAQNQETGRVTARISSSDIALIRSLVLVFALLLLLYMPLAISIASGVPVPTEIFLPICLLFFTNHSINWIVYGLMNKNFKNGYRRLLLRCVRCQTNVVAASDVMTLQTLATNRQDS